MNAGCVSVIIPCHNAEAYLGATLESVFRQSWKNFEIIVVDDGSTDGSSRIAAGYGERITHIRQEQAGAARARNRGYEASTGEYIQYLDADDLLSPDKLELQVRALRDCPGCVATCAWGRFYESEREAYFPPDPMHRDFSPLEFLQTLYAECRMLQPAVWLVPRTLAEKTGPWHEELTLDDDGEYFARIVLGSRKVIFVPKAETYYRSGLEGSLSRQRSAKHWESQWTSVDLSCSYLLRADDSEESIAACARRYGRFLQEVPASMRGIREEVSARLDALGHPHDGPARNAFSRLKSAATLALRQVFPAEHPHRTAEARKHYRPIRGL